MCDSLEESDGRITADYQVEPKCIVGILPEEESASLEKTFK